MGFPSRHHGGGCAIRRAAPVFISRIDPCQCEPDECAYRWSERQDDARAESERVLIAEKGIRISDNLQAVVAKVCALCQDLFLRTTAIPNRDKRLMTTEQSPKIGALSLDRRGIFGIAAGGALAALLSACSLPPRGIAVPIGHSTKASVLGLPNERFFPLSGTEPLEAEFAAAADRRRQALGLASDARH